MPARVMFSMGQAAFKNTEGISMKNSMVVFRRSVLLFHLGVFVALGVLVEQVAAQASADEAEAVARVVARLEPEVRRAMLDGNIPSITLALSNREGEMWSGAWGVSNLWARTPASTQTIYLIGSTFKAQSTVALLQQMEQGKFSLDDRVSDYLPDLEIRGERAGYHVTFRHLLTHTSGMPVDFGPHLVWGETAPLMLSEYLQDSLRVETPPLSGVVYSNMAYSLVAHLVQEFSGVPYKEYVRQNVWSPLGMLDTEFDISPEMEERLAVPYVPDDATGRNVATFRLKANVWPAGIVYGTIHDQARWVSFNLGDGIAGGQEVLKPETIGAMQTLQFPDMAGSLPGYTAFVMGNRARGHGVSFLTNGNSAHPHLVRLSNLAIDLMAEEFRVK